MAYKNYRIIRMSDGTLKLVRDLGRGWGGLRTFETVMTLSVSGLFGRMKLRIATFAVYRESANLGT